MKVLEIISSLRENGVVPKVENGTLKLAGKTKEIPHELLLTVKANKEEMISFLEGNKAGNAADIIKKRDLQDHYPLSNAQRRLWILSKFDGGSAAYNISTSLYLKGDVDQQNLEKAFHQNIHKHESLRTVFQEIDGEPVQVIKEDIGFRISMTDLSAKSGIKQALKEEIEKANNTAFDLVNGPLLAVQLFKISADEYAMIFTLHHIISDGWSIGLLVQEVMQNYRNICLGKEEVISPLDVQYKDFTYWLNDKIEGEFGEQSTRFWQGKELADVEPLTLPYDFQRPDINSFEGAVQKFYLDAHLYQQVEALSRKEKNDCI